MKEEYKEIYNKIFKSYYSQLIRDKHNRESEYFILKEIKEYLNNSSEFRADAKYFLLVNLHHLIIRPIIKLNNSQYKNDNILLKKIYQDIDFIKEKCKEGNRSSHEILKIINDWWEKLEILRFDVWG